MLFAVFLGAATVFVGLSLCPAIRSFLGVSTRLLLAAIVVMIATKSPGALVDYYGACTLFAKYMLIFLPIAFAMESFAMSARLLDVARGAQFSEQALPGFGQVSVLEHAGRFFSVLWIFLIDYQAFFTAVTKAGGRPLRLQAGLQNILELSAEAFYAGFYVAAPLLLVALLIDVNAVAIAKLLPKFPVAFELLAVKLLLILLCLLMRLHAVPAALEDLRFHTQAVVTNV